VSSVWPPPVSSTSAVSHSLPKLVFALQIELKSGNNATQLLVGFRKLADNRVDGWIERR
jgi:hypothetical protein